jgi:hypothetical protein
VAIKAGERTALHTPSDAVRRHGVGGEFIEEQSWQVAVSLMVVGEAASCSAVTSVSWPAEAAECFHSGGIMNDE